ncbi:hypothetical protein V8C26DRAFT_437495 [Trichoderma gracile]
MVSARLAIPECRPGVQIFALEPPPPWYQDDPRRRPYAPRWETLQAPRVAPRDAAYGWYFRAAHTVAPSWDANNPSTYLVASGLWTACRQSRQVMQETYETVLWDNYRRLFPDQVKFSPDTERDKLERMPATLHVRDRGKDRYFTVFPNHDLFYFQSMDLAYCPWTFPTPIGLPIKLRNIAVQLNPAWADGLVPAARTAREEDGPPRAMHYFLRLATLVPPDGFIWFIDYRLQRRPYVPTRAERDADASRYAFYGSDRRYVEVMGAMPPNFDQYYAPYQTLLPMLDPPPVSPFTPGLGQNWRWVEDLRQGEGLKLSGALFIQNIQKHLKYLYENQPQGTHVLDGTEGDRFGVLACEFY